MSDPRTDPGAARALIPPAIAAEIFEQSLAIAPPLGLRDVGARLLAPLVRATGAVRASIMLVNPQTGRLRIVAGMGIRAEWIGRDAAFRPKSISEWVFLHREGLVLDGEVSTDALAGTSETPIESAMSLPLEGDHGILGVVNLARLGADLRFSAEEMAALQSLLPPIASALERALRTQRAEEVAQQLLHSSGLTGRTLLPAGLFESRQYEFGLARRASACEGGDFCDRALHSNGSHSLLAADIAGDGVPAMMTASFLQGLFVASASPERSAAGAVARMNAELHQRGAGAQQASLWVAQLSPTGQLSSCNAGYPEPIWVPSDGSDVVRLGSGGPPIGLMLTGRWEEESVRLLPGDMVVAVSDAVVSARHSSGRAFGDERLIELITEHRRHPLDKLAEAVLAAVAAWSGRQVPADDLSVLAVRYTPGN